MPKQVIDFNQFLNEVEQEGHEITIGEKTYELPAEMPAEFILSLWAIEGGEMDNMKQMKMMVGMLRSVYGAEEFEEIVRENKLSMPQLAQLVKTTMSLYQGQVNEAKKAEEAKQKTPKRTKKS